jgi:hypothetical protein
MKITININKKFILIGAALVATHTAAFVGGVYTHQRAWAVRLERAQLLLTQGQKNLSEAKQDITESPQLSDLDKSFLSMRINSANSAMIGANYVLTNPNWKPEK